MERDDNVKLDLSKLLNVALASTKVKSIINFEGKRIRPVSHVLLLGRMGSFKSTICREIAKEKKVFSTSLTKATLVGAVDKTTGVHIKPTIWRSRNSVLFIDEFNWHIKKNPAKLEIIKSLIELLEYPEYEKPIGYRCNDIPKISDDFNEELYFEVKDNIIRCKSNFMFLANTMDNPYVMGSNRSTDIKALLTRCIVIEHYPTRNEIIEHAMGEKDFYVYEDIIPKHEKLVINKKLSEKFFNFIDEKGTIAKELLMRTWGDLARAYAIVGWDEDLFKLLVQLNSIKGENLGFKY